MTLKKIGNTWHRLSACGYIWRETNYSDLDVKIKVITDNAIVAGE